MIDTPHHNKPLPLGKTAHDIFESCIQEKGDKIAIRYKEQCLTYSELNALANSLAHQLLSQKFDYQSLIAISLDSSPEMIIAILAVLKAGFAYVPIDPDSPRDRIQFILNDIAAPALITTKERQNNFQNLDHGIVITVNSEILSDNKAKQNPDIGVGEKDLAYCIYTSGSTGRPKGVLIEHKSLVNLIRSEHKYFNHPVKNFLFTYSFAFDGSVSLIFKTLLEGATLVIGENGIEKDIHQIANIIKRESISHLMTFPSQYNILLESASADLLSSLEIVSVAGEACPGSLVKLHHQIIPQASLYNQYGPTETTVGCTIYKTSPDHTAPKTPIGTCIENVTIHLLDEQQQPVKDGAIGEICIGGDGLARGYLNRPELNLNKFIKNPLGSGRLYRSGDLGRRLPDGNLDFIGRKDFQVKLRGYRIEPGEIEARLLQHKKVRETIVLLVGEKAESQKLLAFFVPIKNEIIDQGELKQFLEKKLPVYMIPSKFISLEKMPLTNRGKIDRQALSNYDFNHPQKERPRISPFNDIELFILKKWKQILELDHIDPDDKFFEIGGNSLLAARFIAELQNGLKENIFITSIFENPTISTFADMLRKDYTEAIATQISVNLSSSLKPKQERSLEDTDFQNFKNYFPKHSPPQIKAKKNKKAIFILAPPRSGTSLLRVMLAGHPQLFAANELQLLHFEDLAERARAYTGKYNLWQEGLIRALMEIESLDVEQAKSWLQEEAQKACSVADFYHKIQSRIADKILVDKSPSYILDPQALQRAEHIFENALYIHLYRHPYAMIRSFEKMHMDQVLYLRPHPYTSAQTGELIWQQSHENALRFLQNIPKNRQSSLAYEDLIKNPETSMRKLCEELNLDFYSDLLEPYKALDQKMTDGLYKDSKPMGDINLLGHGRIKPQLADKWKGVIEDNFLHKKTWKTAYQLGYPKITDIQSAKSTISANVEQSKNIAIIGMAARFPGAKNLDEFWNNLVEAKDISSVFSPDELQASGIDPKEFKDPDYVPKGIFLEDAACFDAAFFGYLPKEAALMDPQHRIFLECAYHALEDAGYKPQRNHLKIGVFGGVARNTYLINNVLTHPNYFKSIDDFQLGITLEKDFPATRVAYKLNLKGPAINIQTACSTSGVAVHLACQSILTGDSDMTIVGGGRIQPPLASGHLHKEGHALSPDAYCRTFDEQANGMVRGHGMAFIVLKKLEKAIADGDHIHAVIKGTAINNDGSEKIGFTAPSIQGQSEVIIRAYQNANINPETVSYIEAHGTGTAIGDPIEFSGLSKAFGTFTSQKQFCHIGSVKANIGHLDAGACVAGIIKTILAMQHKAIPPLMHFQKANPQLNIGQSPFIINKKTIHWKKGEHPRRAGVSSFGLGGTNAHIVLEEASPSIKKDSEKSHQLLLFSAKSETALMRIKEQYSNYFDNNKKPFSTIAHTLQVGRRHFENRFFLIAKDAEDAKQKFTDPEAAQLFYKKAKEKNQKIAFLFPGGGAQYTSMGFELFQQEPLFKKSVLECLDILKEDYQLDYFDILYPKNQEQRNRPITDPLEGITLLFTVEYATAKLWESWGIVPSELIGHSLGEYTAACISGVFSLRAALGIVATRGKLFQTLKGGGMLSVALPEKDLQKYLYKDISIAAINKPDNCVLSGSNAALDQIQEVLVSLDISHSRLHISVAAHSAIVEPILEEFGKYLEGVKFSPPKIPLISNVSGRFADSEKIQTPSYWLDHLKQTVRFSDGIETLLNLENRILLETGPGQTLSTFTRQHPAKKDNQLVLASIRHPKEPTNDYAFILKSIGQLWLSGVDIQWSALHHHLPGRIPLPKYPFERTRHWINPKHQKIIESYTSMNQSDKHKDGARQIKRRDLVLENLKDIFHQLSGINKDQLHDSTSFLELGFDSLFLTQAVAKIKKQLPVKINFRQLFEEAPNLNALTTYLDKQLPDDFYSEEIEKLNKEKTNISSSPLIENPNEVISATKVNYAIHSEQIVPSKQPDSQLQNIIQQQLNLMQQQLALLSGQTVHIEKKTEEPEPPAEKNKNPINKVSDIQQQTSIEEKNNPPFSEKKASVKAAAHGPWKPLEKKGREGWSEQQKNYLKNLIQRYTERTKGSQELSQAQRKHLADPRSITGFNRLWKDMVYQIAVERSKGSKIWDVDGNEYIDYRNAFGISLFGHTPDFIQEAVKIQLEKGFELGVLSPLAKKVADLLCALSGCERATLVNTGSEAIVAAVRAARTVSMKDKVIVFEGDYHGIADELLVRAVKMNGRTKAMPVAPGIPKLAVQNMIILDYDDPDVLKKIKAHVHEVAAVIIEPIQPNRPSRQPRELFQQIRKLTAQNDIALIFDEMITGFRLALGGAQEWYNIKADLIAYGKIISGGLPMAALAGKSKYMDVFDGGQWNFGDDSYPEAGLTFFGGTFVKHPLALASSYAALSEIKKQGSELYEALNAKTTVFANRLKTLFLKTKAPLRVRATASIVSIQITDDNPMSRLIFYYLRLKGIHITEKAALISTAHTEKDLNHTVTLFEESIKEMQTAGFFKITVAEVEDQNLIIRPPSQQTLKASATPPLVKKKLPLTEGQKEIWVEQQLGKGAAAAYNLGSEFHLTGLLNLNHFKTAFQKLIARHEALRTRFSKTETVQFILDQGPATIDFQDISDRNKTEQLDILKRIRFNEGELSFDIFDEVPFRAKMVKCADTEHYFYFSIHHIIADGWSMGVLLNDLARLYSIECGAKESLPGPKQLSAFIKERLQLKDSETQKKALAFWQDQFKEDIPILEFPTDLARPASKSYSAQLERLEISKDLLLALKRSATTQKTTLFNLIYTAFQVFIYRLSHQEDFVLGITSAAQAESDNPHLVAHGVNLLPVRLQTNPEDSFARVLGNTRSKLLDAFEHQSLAFGSLVQNLKVPRDPSRTPIISILFNMDSPLGTLDFANLEVSMQPIQRNYETFDIFINVKPTKDSLIIEWIYNTDLFYTETIQRRLNSFVRLLESIIENPEQQIGRLNILPPSERKTLLHDWNDNVYERSERVLHQYLEEQAVTTPDRIAAVDAHRSMTYHQLNQRANQVAHYFVAKGVHTGNFIGVYFERSVDMIIALMACMKIGAIYVPLDPNNPMDRLKVILEDARADFLITSEHLLGTVSSSFENIICLDRDESLIRACSTSNLFKRISPDQLVYVNYTSGSTGKPKGVLIPHRAVIDHHLSIIKALDLTEDEKIFSVASIAFDPSVQDFFLPLMIGAQVYIASEMEKKDGFQLRDTLQKVQPTLMQATPSTFRMLLMTDWQGDDQLTILCGGEGLNKELSNKLVQRSKRLYNIYGPTETTIWSTLKRLEGDRLMTKAESAYEPIGRPIDNVQVYLLDQYMQAVPIGVAGELYIGGAGVAPNGYFKREVLNAEKFVDNPFDTFGKKLYRTGDLARYLSNGDLEYLNRVDSQVKIRGFRIELGEIEAAIDQYDAIRENVVMIREDQKDKKQLVAYCIPKQGAQLDFEDLKQYLSKKLPDYMIPAAFVSMKQFPLTATMKVNRSKLPPPESTKQKADTEIKPAKTDTEKLILNIWSDILDESDISIDDDFFALGGHSIDAINMIALLEQKTKKKLPLATLLENATIRQLGIFLDDDQKIEKSINSSLVPIKPKGTKTPLYLVHGAGLHVLMFQTLAANMDEDQVLYALQARGLNGEAEPFDKMEDIAAHYIREILEQNPDGPYALAGYSFGGLIAFEMAKQLKALGKEIKMLAMFDTIVHKNITGLKEHNNYYKRLSNLGKKVAWNISLLAKDPIPNLKYKSHVLKRRYQRWVGQNGKNDIKEADAVFGGKVDQANKKAFDQYQLTPYDGKIYLFKARAQRFYLDDFESLGWQPFALGGVEIHEVPGDHLTLFDPPHGGEFAKILQGCLNNLNVNIVPSK